MQWISNQLAYYMYLLAVCTAQENLDDQTTSEI
jgi:hypothetical protein